MSLSYPPHPLTHTHTHTLLPHPNFPPPLSLSQSEVVQTQSCICTYGGINNKWRRLHIMPFVGTSSSLHLSFILLLLSAGTTASSPLSSPSPHYTPHWHARKHTHAGIMQLSNETLPGRASVTEGECSSLWWAHLPPFCPCLLCCCCCCCCCCWTSGYGYPRLAARIQAPGNSISNSINAASMTSPRRRLIGPRHCQHWRLPANERAERGWGRVVSSLCWAAGWVVESLFHYMAQECVIMCVWVCMYSMLWKEYCVCVCVCVCVHISAGGPARTHAGH